MNCDKKCRYFPNSNADTYQCQTHKSVHVCDQTCKTRITTSEGEFCFLTGRQKMGVECLLYDFTHSCTRVVFKTSAVSRKARRATASEKRNRWLCPVSDVAEIIRRLYCTGKLRDATSKMAGTRAANKLSRPTATHCFERIMVLMRVGVHTAASHAGSPWVTAVSIAIADFANRLKLYTSSTASAAAFPVLLTAVVASKMVSGEVIGGVTVIPRVPWVGKHSFSDVHFNQMNISCRAMSGMWRRIKAAIVSSPDNPIVCRFPQLEPEGAAHPPNPARRNRYFPCVSSRHR